GGGGEGGGGVAQPARPPRPLCLEERDALVHAPHVAERARHLDDGGAAAVLAEAELERPLVERHGQVRVAGRVEGRAALVRGDGALGAELGGQLVHPPAELVLVQFVERGPEGVEPLLPGHSRPSSAIVTGVTDSLIRGLPCQGPAESSVRLAPSDSAPHPWTARRWPRSAPPSTISPSSTSRFMNTACSGHSDCSSIGRAGSHSGPVWLM